MPSTPIAGSTGPPVASGPSGVSTKAPTPPRIVVWVTALVLVVTAGARTAPGAFLLDMEADTGWSKGLLSLAAALGLIVFGVAGPVSGVLMGRHGVRRVTLAALAVTAASMSMVR